MLWYEHLLGILAILTCINGIIVLSAIRVGSMADKRLMKHAKNDENPENSSNYPDNIEIQAMDATLSIRE